MSFPKKKVLNYSKSLFQNAKALFSMDSSPRIKIKTIRTIDPSRLACIDFSRNTVNKIHCLKRNNSQIYKIGQDLRLLSAMIQNSPSLKASLQTISQYNLTKQQKLKLVIQLFSSVPPRLLSNFLKLLSENDELDLIPDISIEYNKLVFDLEKITPIALISATPFQFRQKSIVFKTLKRLTSSKEMILTGGYKKNLLGGFILEYKSCSIDASVFKEFNLLFNEV